MALLDQQLASAARALDEVRVEGLGGVGDSELLLLIAASARNERVARAHSAVLAGELVRRSAPELGHDGMAQKSGHRTPQKLIQATTGVTSREAVAAVRVGGLADTHPWLGSVARGSRSAGLDRRRRFDPWRARGPERRCVERRAG